MIYTALGLREMSQGLREAKAMIRRRRLDLQAQIGLLESELRALDKIESSVEPSLEVLREEQARREAAEKAKAGAT